MAAKPIPQHIVDRVVADHRTGKFTVRELAKKYNLGLATIAKATKGIEKDCEQIVDAGVEYIQGLNIHDERTANAIANAVDAKVRIKENVEKFVDAAVEKGIDLLKSTDSGQDFKAICDGVDKVSITAKINERHAKPNQTTTNLGVAVGDGGTMRRPTNIVINGRKSAN